MNMKKILCCVIAAMTIVLFSNCEQVGRNTKTASNQTRFVLFIYFGDQTAPAFPFLIYTNENDTTYLKYCKMESRYTVYDTTLPLPDYVIDRIKKYHVNDSVFDLVSKYVIEHDTKASTFTEAGFAGNYWVFFQDGNDSTEFALGGTTGGACQVCDFFKDIQQFVPEFDE